ncbi:hypothetical protein JCM19239_492 [Vibrio variabilis]|uniref:Uncharacterized protein n=1 Tax=Vibrio variabilis TaxID=990271 RepID=A0ABQ0JRW5_9VIBR|nr:hypothetical protein JCM19239_492 [Vibrio variabilis]
MTLSPKSDSASLEEITSVAHGLETELKRIPGTRDIYTVGRQQQLLMLDSTLQKCQVTVSL